MAIEKDQGNYYEIKYEGSDDLTSFIRLLRNIFPKAKKDLNIYMELAPLLKKDSFASIVFSGKALRDRGCLINIVLSKENYKTMVTSEHITPFNLSYPGQEEEISHEETIELEENTANMVLGADQPSRKPGEFLTLGNVLYIEEDNVDELPNKLSGLIQKIKSQGAQKIVINLTNVGLITPPILEALALETLNLEGLLQIEILQELFDILADAPQASVLDIVVAKEKANVTEIASKQILDGK
jgi:hypothetical protein